MPGDSYPFKLLTKAVILDSFPYLQMTYLKLCDAQIQINFSNCIKVPHSWNILQRVENEAYSICISESYEECRI